jgi:hypothetical protein
MSAVRDFDADTIIIYPWQPNRNLYLVYLDLILKNDPRSKMIGISTPADARAICENIIRYRHVVAIGHESGKSNIRAIDAMCGRKWKNHISEQFDGTFSEHWIN